MKIAILGYGREGQSAYRYWNKPANQLTIHDNNEQLLLDKNIDCILGPGAFIDLDDHGYDLLVRSPGLRLDFDKIKTPITTVTNEFMYNCPATIIGITGTKGKGTTSTLVYEILALAGRKTHLLGNIGTPALDMLDKVGPEDIVVYEMSSFQLYDAELSPHVAVCLIVAEDHLDWHADLKEYHNAKGNIFKFQKDDDVAVYFADDQVSSGLALSSKARQKIAYGESGDVSVKNDKIVAFGQVVVDVDEIALPGPHNLENACAAVAAVWTYTQDLDAIAKVLKTFTGLPFHIELVGELNGAKIYNDSFSSNPTAAAAAINSFNEPMVLFLGGVERGVDFGPVIKALENKRINKIITYGQSGKRVQQELSRAGIVNVEEHKSKNFNEIIMSGLSVAQPGDVVLFSPGSASQDMFNDFKQRGDAFNSIVGDLKE